MFTRSKPLGETPANDSTTVTARRGAILLMLLALASTSAASAQSTGTLEGVVRDEAGAIAGARVIAIDSLTNERRRAVTNDRGFFRMIDVSAGRYAVTATMIGHPPLTQLLDLVAGQRAQLDFNLRRANTLETVRVEESLGDPAAIRRMSVSTTLLASDIQSLPLNTRNIMNLAATAPGMRSFQPVSGYSLPSAGSLRNERAINLYVDGVEMKNMNSSNVVGAPQSGSLIPVDALQEFRVLLNPYDAEYTRGAAYIISAVTQRGTNETHGSAFGFFQNRELIAVNDFQRQIPNFEKPDANRGQFGFTLRGPVVRNRLFYALSYELSNTHSYVAVVPGQPAANPAYWDKYAGVFDMPNRNNAALLHTTFTANETNTFEAIGSSRRLTNQSGFGGIQARESAVGQTSIVNTLNLRHRWLPVAGLANEMSLQYVRWSSEERPEVNGPAFVYQTLTIGHGDATMVIHETQLRAIDRVTWAIGSGPGSHLLKVGAEVGRVRADQFAPNNAQGVFQFRSETGNPTQANIAVGFTDSATERDALNSLAGWITGAYINDEWHIAQRLLLNLGLRYDAELNTMNNDFTVPWASDTALSSRPELQGLLNRGNRRDDLNNISPRLSFSWDVTGRQLAFLRGGFGIMFDRIPEFIPFAERQSATWRTYQFPNPGTTDPEVLRDRVIAGTGPAGTPAMTLLPNRMDVPENRQWSVGIGVQLTRAIAVNMDYLDQQLRHLYAPVNLNWLDASVTPRKRVLSSRYGNITAWGDFARAHYRALLTSISYNRDTTIRLTLAHTLGSANADWDVVTTPVPAKFAKQYYVMQRTSGDERHRYVLSGSWVMWQGVALSMIGTAASPRPYRTTVGVDLNQDNLLDDDWIGGNRYVVPKNDWNNWYRVLDLRLTKSLGVARGARISLIAEGFNVLNTSNYSGYSGAQMDSVRLRPDFGSPNAVFATRQFQLGTKVQF